MIGCLTRQLVGGGADGVFHSFAHGVLDAFSDALSHGIRNDLLEQAHIPCLLLFPPPRDRDRAAVLYVYERIISCASRRRKAIAKMSRACDGGASVV